ncbi:sulfotransferase family 2 domain-containing protein [Roseobacteraceae bacterium S113]
MIISRGRRYIFVHIPKTGGTAMALALEDRAMADDILIGDTPKAQRRKRRLKDLKPAGRLWKHATLADIDGIVSAEDMAQMCIFTLVRNPWDRMVSYYHWLRDQSFEHKAVATAKRLEFGAFLADAEVALSIKSSPARRYVSGARGGEVPAHFVRLEHFEADFAPVAEHLGFDVSLPRANASARRADYQSYYTREDAERVAEMAAEDIARFGYSF